MAKVTVAVDLFNLVVPLAAQPTALATAMRTTDTAGQLELFGSGRSGAVAPLIDADTDLRQGDVDRTNGRSIAPTATTLGCRTSATATRATTTRITSFRPEPSADQTAARHADFSFQDLVQAYLDCRRAKRTKPSARAFEMHQEAQLARLNEALTQGTYRPGKSVCFVITRPKPREVWAAPFADRVVHHLLYNKIAPRFERAFIADSCACIPGRGTLYAARRLEHHIRGATQNWSRRVHYLKLDVANFFVSIDKPTLRELLARRVHEPWWMVLTEQILMHDPRPGALMQSGRATMARVPAHKSLLNQSADRGLPIGNLSSQFFANVYLDVLDQFVKHRLGCRHYVRYVDDFILLHESPQWLNRAKAAIEQFLDDRLQLRLNPAKTILQPVERGVDFVGQVVKPWRRTLRRRTYHEAIVRAASIDAVDLFTTANSYFGLMRQASHSHHDRGRLANVLRGRERSVNKQLTKTYRRPA